jgi:hypothetical protein
MAQHTTSEWRCHSRVSMRRFCGLFIGTNSSIHTHRPAIATILSWASQRSVTSEGTGNLAPVPLDDDVPAAVFYCTEGGRKIAVS